MSLCQALSETQSCSESFGGSFEVLTKHLSPEWVEASLSLSSHATIRRRRLPQDMVLWLVIGMAMFRNEPINEVARRLNICAQGLATAELLARSALSQARQRLGAQPMKWLFKQCARVWGRERYAQDDWKGLQLFAIDGALFRTQDTPELRAHFGSGNTGTQRQTPYPMLRLVALMNVRSHVIADATVSPYRTSEMRLAEEFIAGIPDDSVTLLDKGFFGAGLLLEISHKGHERHWLLPSKKNLRYEVIEHYGDGDQLVQMTVSYQARKRNPSLPRVWTARAVSYEVGGKQKTVLTSLPASHYSAKEVARLYHERWEIELGFRDIKSSMQHNEITLRSKKVELVYQELWGVLLAYNLVRREASKAAIEHGRIPSDISFKFAFQFIAAQLVVMSGAVSPSHTPRRLAELRGAVATLFIKKRTRPPSPRTVKISKTRYPLDRYAAPLK